MAGALCVASTLRIGFPKIVLSKTVLYSTILAVFDIKAATGQPPMIENYEALSARMCTARLRVSTKAHWRGAHRCSIYQLKALDAFRAQWLLRYSPHRSLDLHKRRLRRAPSNQDEPMRSMRSL